MTPTQRDERDPPDDGLEDQVPRQSVLDGVLTHLPRRNLVKVVFLLLLLAAIVFFQQRADLVARLMTNTLAPATPPAKTNSSPAHTP